MNFDRALVLLLASIGAVAGFTPSGRAAVSVASSHLSSRVAFTPRVSALFSEVEQAAEATETAAAASVDEPAAAPAFDAAIYVGNISFGQLCLFPCPAPIMGLIRLTRHRVSHFDIFACTLLKSKIPLKVILGLSFLRMDRFPRCRCRLTEIR
jgi:hypothetical protein